MTDEQSIESLIEAAKDEELEKMIELMVKFRKSVALFVRVVIGVEPTDQQLEVLDAISEVGAKVSVKSGHGTGKSTVFAWIILWHVSCFPDSKCPATAPTSHQLEDVLWAEIAKWHTVMDPWFKDRLEIGKSSVAMKEAPKTQFAVARTARKEKPEALQGFHATNLLFLIDEASGVHQAIFEVAEGALSTDDARVLMAANPTQVVGYFYDSHHKMKHRFKRITLSCLDSPMVDRNYIDDMKKKYGEESDIYRVRVLGEFPKASVTQLISETLYQESCDRDIKEEQFAHAAGVLGVDVAWEGDDRSVIYYRKGIYSKILNTWRGIDNMTLASMVIQYEDEYHTDATFIDIGWGAGVIDRLRQLGRAPLGVNFGGKARDERYADKRTEMWCSGKTWLEDGGVLVDEEDLREDLMGPQFFFLPSGKIKLESKKDMKKRGLASPDVADALMLTFAAPVTPAGFYGRKLHFAQSKYDPLARSASRNGEDQHFANGSYDLLK